MNAFVNYSFQADPVIEGFDPREANFPPNHRFNAGFNFSHDRFLGNLSVNYTADRPIGRTCSISASRAPPTPIRWSTAAVGVRWLGDRVTTSLKITNIGNTEVQQHIFGDILRRQVVGEARFTF